MAPSAILGRPKTRGSRRLVPGSWMRLTGRPPSTRSLRNKQLPDLAEELRHEIIRATAANGGHVGPNLGVVDLTIALHRVFGSGTDRLSSMSRTKDTPISS